MAHDDSDLSLPVYTMDEVAEHDNEDDLWVVIHGRVYNVTEYLDDHPGGDTLLEGAGVDATDMFEDIGHSEEAIEEMKRYLIGRIA